jgi:spore coat protein U domain-containing protein, fimbrial subunit CupE1/2/3/6
MTFSTRLFRLAAVMGCACAASSIRAATSTTSFQVQLTIVASCSVAAPATLDFGSTGSLAAVAPATTTINVTCTPTTAYDIGLNKGLYGSSVSDRKMQGAVNAAQITYKLTQDVAGLVNWGETIASDTVTGVGTGLAVGHVVYSSVPAQATPVPDVYSDTITVTITY